MLRKHSESNTSCMQTLCCACARFGNLLDSLLNVHGSTTRAHATGTADQEEWPWRSRPQRIDQQSRWDPSSPAVTHSLKDKYMMVENRPHLGVRALRWEVDKHLSQGGLPALPHSQRMKEREGLRQEMRLWWNISCYYTYLLFGLLGSKGPQGFRV
eukprot:1405370-Amphidinium_carterae.1